MAARARPVDAAALDETLASLAEGLRVVSVLLHPYIPASSARLLEAIGARGSNTTPRRFHRTWPAVR